MLGCFGHDANKKSMLVILLSVILFLIIYITPRTYIFISQMPYYYGQIVAFLLLSITSFSVGKIITNRHRQVINQYEELHQSQERLSVILSSVADGVITTRPNGTIEFMNPVAEEMTGWSVYKAQGEKFEDIFRIINEFLRESVENLVRVVQRTGKMYELENHTILISKKCREINRGFCSSDN